MSRTVGPYGLLFRALLVLWVIGLAIAGVIALPSIAEYHADSGGRQPEEAAAHPILNALLPLLIVFLVGVVLFLFLGVMWLVSGRHHGPWY